MKHFSRRFYRLTVCAAVLSLGRSASVRAETYERHEGAYKLINPLLECVTDENQFKLLTSFRQKVEALIQRIPKEKTTHVSVYFRDLNNGPWFGINEKETFTPASLLKVPIMISYYKQAEDEPQVLNKKINFHGKPDEIASQVVKPSTGVEQGHYYTVEELIRRMIVYSDNVSLNLLARNVPEAWVRRTYKDFGMPTPSDDEENFMTVKNYASFFRILFNSSYLNRSFSEKSLMHLTQTEFKQGIVSGVPASVTVAHKFGERVIQSGPDKLQLHDCGIVYYPSHPYLICIMTRGDDMDELAQTIRNVSELVYREVDQQMKK